MHANKYFILRLKILLKFLAETNFFFLKKAVKKTEINSFSPAGGGGRVCA